VSELLSHSIEQCRREKSSQQHAAAHRRRTRRQRSDSALLDGGADVNAVNQWNETPLIVACCGGHVRAVRALLAHGADCASLDRWQSSALDVAEAHQAVDVVELLRHIGTTWRIA
jgi:ankyrin repeat protein